MKVLLQRVSRAAVRVEGRTVGSIERGLLVFVGVERGDLEVDADYCADKTAQLRIFSDDAGRMNRSVEDVGGACLVVSQFTLAGSTGRGNRPSFDAAAPAQEARALYGRFAERLSGRGLRVETGTFQAMMEVELVNDGPVTLLLEPRGRETAP
jgi:D-tyrosyl-tRNA(Tyr) deacylase